MIFQKKGFKKDNLYLLGAPELPAYLVDANNPAVFDAGAALFGQTYIKEIQKILKGRPPRYLFLTHSHYDHCGSVSQLKNAFPEMIVAASKQAKENFTRPKVIAQIKTLNDFISANADALNIKVKTPVAFQPFEVDLTVREGDSIQLSPDVTLTIVETPGHTRDCASYYIKEPGILIAGESLGIADQTGYIYSEWLHSYNDYVASIKKLGELNPSVICLGHYSIFTDDDAGMFPGKALQQSFRFRELIEQSLEDEHGDIEKTMARIKCIEYDHKPDPKQPEPAYLLNLVAKINAVAKLKGQGPLC